jgi:hypothetical protein
MAPEDRRAIETFFERMCQATTERDAEAERLIDDLMQRHPQTKYYITQMAFFQEHALAEAQNRVRELEHEQAQQGSGGLLGGLFGGGRRPAPQRVHAPGWRPGLFEQRGGFLGNAVSTAAGVMGGMVLGSLLGSMLAPGTTQAAEPETVPEPDLGFEDAGFLDEEL